MGVALGNSQPSNNNNNNNRLTNIPFAIHPFINNLQKAGNIANFCNEPLKLNGSLALLGEPVMTYDDQLLTSIASTQAPTQPLVSTGANESLQPASSSAKPALRQHQVLVVGTGEGALKRIVLLPGELGFGLRGHEFDSVQLDEQSDQPILADLHLLPGSNPQLGAGSGSGGESTTGQQQFALAATRDKLVKVRVNACKAAKRSNSSSSSMDTECHLCAQLQDPFCGWCATSGQCSTRDECQSASTGNPQLPAGVHWSPFDQIKCADYQPVVPQFVPLQTTSLHQPIEVNVRLAPGAVSGAKQSAAALALQLTHAQFTCHFDYLALAASSLAAQPRLSGATTKATQARLNVHTSTVVIGCPLPPPIQRPPTTGDGQVSLRTRLSVRPMGEPPALVRQLFAGQQSASKRTGDADHPNDQQVIERELGLYDCSQLTSCRSCLSTGNSEQQRFHCAWCPLSNKCTFNASHPDLGCAASAIISTTPHSLASQSASSNSNSVRPSHLTPSLAESQASVFGLSIERANQCPSPSSGDIGEPEAGASNSGGQPARSGSQSQSPNSGAQSRKTTQAPSDSNAPASARNELLIPNQARRSIQVPLRQPFPVGKRGKLECQLEIEGAKARWTARLVEQAGSSQQVVVCNENTFAYHEELATQRAQLLVIHQDTQVIDMMEGKFFRKPKPHSFEIINQPERLTNSLSTSIAPHSDSLQMPFVWRQSARIDEHSRRPDKLDWPAAAAAATLVGRLASPRTRPVGRRSGGLEQATGRSSKWPSIVVRLLHVPERGAQVPVRVVREPVPALRPVSGGLAGSLDLSAASNRLGKFHATLAHEST